MFKKIFIRGMMAVIPIALTIAIIIWLFTFLERIFGWPIKALIGPEYYFPGLGIIVALILIYILGAILNFWLMQKIYRVVDKIFSRIPLIKTLYSSICDFMNFFRSQEKQKQDQVVMIEISHFRFLGLVTRHSFDDLPQGIGTSNDVAVFIPMSYQIGGFTVMVPHDKVQKIDMSFEEAMRFVVTAGVLVPKENENKPTNDIAKLD